jgi:uncharacterized protein YggE
MRITKRLSTVLVFLVTTLALSAQAQESKEPPLITVTGQAEVKVAPDEVVFNIVVEQTNMDLAAAKSANDESVRKVLALARNYNVEPQNVQTDYISVEPKYNTDDEDDESKRKRVFIGYSVSKTVVIRLKDLSRFENLFSDILKAGVTRIRNVDFRTTELRKYKDQARAMAIKAAQEKAIALTKEIGQTIGRAYSIRENGYEGGDLRSNNSFVVSGNYSDNESTFAPGLITVQAQVTVSFRLL